jgi:hypothetical protein
MQEKQFKGVKIYFGSWFQKSQSMVNLLHCCGPVVRQNIMAERAGGGAKLLTSWSAEIRGKDIAISDLLLPTRPHLQKFSSLPNKAIKL